MGKKGACYGKKIEFFPQMFLKNRDQASGEEKDRNGHQNKTDTKQTNGLSQFR